MKRIYLEYILVTFLLFPIFILTSSSFAQVDVLGMSASGTAEVGGRIIGGHTESSKYEEYREFREILFDRLFLGLENKGETHSFELRLTDPLEEDKNLALRKTRYGKYYLELSWDQIPHVFSNTARTLFDKTSPTNLTVDDNVQASLQATPTNANLVSQLARAHRVPTENRQDTGSFKIRWTPNPEWDLRAGYSLERQNGTIPFGRNFAFVITEVAAPVDWRTQSVNASAELAKKDWSLRFNYDGSFFRNGVGKLVVDNLFRVTDSPTLGARQSRHDLYPDNQAHTFSISGAKNLPLRSRVTGTVSVGWMFQDDDFLPRTINSALPPFDSVASLPATSLEGKLRTFLLNLIGTSRPWDPLSFTARFRHYDLHNTSRSITYQPVNYDTTPQVIVPGVPLLRRNLPYAFSKSNAGLEGNWRIIKPLTFKLGWDWESWHREFREVSRTNEHALVSSVVYLPRDWVNVRLSYRQSWRRWNRYNPEIVEESFPAGEPVPVFEGMRKFDMANRNTGRVELITQVTPTDKITLSPVFSWSRDSYPDSEYGVLGDQIYGYGINFTYTPTSRISFFGDFTREENWYKTKSRQRTIGAIDNPLNDWWTNRRGVTYFASFGADAIIIPNKLNFDLAYASSWEKVVLPTGDVPGTAGFIFLNHADLPNIIYRLHQILATFKYRLTNRLTARAQYRYERWEPQDFARDAIDLNIFGDPLGFGATNVYLGARATAYEAHIGAVALILKF